MARAIADSARSRRALDELAELGDLAAPALAAELHAKRPLGIRRRVEALLEKLGQAERNPTAVRLREMRALEALEAAGTPAARALLQELAEGTTRLASVRAATPGARRGRRQSPLENTAGIPKI